MKDKNKTEQLLIRLKTNLKEDLRKESEQSGLSMSSYIVKKLEGKDPLIQQLITENKEIKEQLSDTFFFLKKDIEELKELSQTKIESKSDTKFDYKEDKDLDLTDINSYSNGDILQIAEEFVLVKNVLKNENKIAILFMKNLEIKVLKLSEHNHLIKSIKKLRG